MFLILLWFKASRCQYYNASAISYFFSPCVLQIAGIETMCNNQSLIHFVGRYHFWAWPQSTAVSLPYQWNRMYSLPWQLWHVTWGPAHIRYCGNSPFTRSVLHTISASLTLYQISAAHNQCIPQPLPDQCCTQSVHPSTFQHSHPMWSKTHGRLKECFFFLFT